MAVRIDGNTQLAGVMGWPIDHTLSPAMHNAAYENLGLPWVYLPLPVREPADVARIVEAIRALPFVGFNVTMPYKRLMLDLCDEVAALARLAGAVNTVHLQDGVLVGYNTDGRGLLASLEVEAGFTPKGSRVAMIGSGGAAAAVLAALVLGGAEHVTVVSRDPAHARDLIERIGVHARGTELESLGMGPEVGSYIESADVVVNATPLGMRPGDPLPLDASWLRAGQIVSDMVYRPAVTPLLEAAARAGAKPVGGLGMLVAQGAMSIELWDRDTTVTAPRAEMRAAAEAAMAAQGKVVVGMGEV
jgi:shikimate dehydrogenase